MIGGLQRGKSISKIVDVLEILTLCHGTCGSVVWACSSPMTPQAPLEVSLVRREAALLGPMVGPGLA